MTSIAALQCVERGVLGLDDDVSGILHEFRDLEVLSGFDGDGRPVLRRAEGRVTLRFVDFVFSSSSFLAPFSLYCGAT